MPAKSKVFVARNEAMLIFKIEGLASMNNSGGMYAFTNECIASGTKDLCINLEFCEGVDSTFMGTLLLMHEEAEGRSGKLYVVNASEYVLSKLNELGVNEIVSVNQSQKVPSLEYTLLPKEDDEKGRMVLVLKAHEELVKNNEENGVKFNSFIKALKGSYKAHE